ncbi:ABC transporter substrate-binding protein [Glaciihabitans sp. UYNi722]|uniref:ABC transporter substrate-binding protein n=1 Tax=Glaciihabitans sp. UYNi722 TaxID=3156344 RepID=UPI003399559E
MTLTYSAPVPGALPFQPVNVAIAEGYFSDENITVQVNQTSPQALPGALVGGQIDMSADVVYSVATYLQNGVGVKFVSGLNGNVDFTLVAAKGANIPNPVGPNGWKKSFAALKGKSIGVAAKAGPIGLTVTELMKEAGVPAGDFTLINTPGAVAGNALAAGQVAAVLTGGGYDAPLIANGLGVKVLTLGGDVPEFKDQSNAAVFMSTKALDAHPGVAARIQKAVARAIVFMKKPANADAVTKIVLAAGAPSTPQLASRIQGYNYDSTLSIAGLDAGFKWAKTVGISQSRVNAKTTIAEGAATK